MTNQEQKHPWMLPSGAPGLILERMLLCQQDVESVVKGTGQSVGLEATAIIDVARAVFNRHGIVLCLHQPSAHPSNEGKGMFVHTELRMSIIAPDGTYLTHIVQSGAMAPQAKSYPAALTVAVKSLLRHVLMVHVAVNESDRRSFMSDELRAWHDVLLAVKDMDALVRVGDHPARLAVSNEELSEARQMYVARRDDLAKELATARAAAESAARAESRLADRDARDSLATPSERADTASRRAKK